MDMAHDLMQALVAAYAMDALEPDERDEVRQHLKTCERCRTDLEGFEQTVAWLSLATPPTPVPLGFAERILTRRAGAPERASSAAKAPRHRIRTALVAAAFVALAAFATWSGLGLEGSRDELRVQRDVIGALLRDEDKIELEGPSEASAQIVPTEEGSLFVATGLPPVAENAVYQLWVKEGEVITSAGTFEVLNGLAIVRIERRFGDFSGALVTTEPPGGSRQPTSVAVLDSL